jgi:uncharacterized damage-inducible protein DinB
MGDQSEIDISPNKHAVLDMFCWMIEEAFDGDEQSLMANLKNIREEDWTALPPGGGRSIADILEHIGWCKWMYQDFAFGTASLRGDQPPLIPADGARTRPHNELIQWLSEGHNLWYASVRNLMDDGELEPMRLTHWGEHLPTQNIIRMMIAHDYYHAGEINHLRSLLQGTDHWEYESSPDNGSMDSDAS